MHVYDHHSIYSRFLLKTIRKEHFPHFMPCVWPQQTTPPSTFTQLDKCLREALTLDGVLEFRHEKFWALAVEDPSHRASIGNRHPTGFMLTGSLHVRIRRDANEQKVLAHVRERLSPLVPLLTVQVCCAAALLIITVKSDKGFIFWPVSSCFQHDNT